MTERRPSASCIDGASRWSCLAELLLRLCAPLSTMILARLLTPEAFGLAAAVTVALSLAEIAQDAGFRTFLIQHPFRSQDELERSAAVALTSALFLSLLLCAVFLLGRTALAAWAGMEEAAPALALAALSLPFSACSGILNARFRREFRFRLLFRVRAAEAFCPLFLTVPLALCWPSFWALVAGMLGRALLRFFMLVRLARRERMRGLHLCFDAVRLSEMLGFSLWTSVEFFVIWLCGSAPLAIVGRTLDAHALGLYSTTVTTATQIMATVSAAFLPVAFSVFSRTQDSAAALREALLLFQRRMAFFLFPLGAGVFLFSDMAVAFLLGPHWQEAAPFLGAYCAALAFVHSICHLSSEAIRAVGRPRLSAMLHGVYAVLHSGLVYWAASRSFACLVWTSFFSCGLFCALHAVCLYRLLRLTAGRMLVTVRFPLLASLIMLGFGAWLKQDHSSLLWDAACVLLCVAVYLGLFTLWRSSRQELADLARMLRGRTEEGGLCSESASGRASLSRVDSVS
ncbi:oligosaccharide flippase family protein [Mailhella sp.]|uniref:oligosaccharide flippase family protein n=1 Tax=Mailhella sp. TaxID=1981029 RepID=UPI0040632FC3